MKILYNSVAKEEIQPDTEYHCMIRWDENHNCSCDIFHTREELDTAHPSRKRTKTDIVTDQYLKARIVFLPKKEDPDECL